MKLLLRDLSFSITEATIAAGIPDPYWLKKYHPTGYAGLTWALDIETKEKKVQSEVEFRQAPGSPGVVLDRVIQVWAWLDGKDYPCRLLADFVGTERILGRDVLNRLEILFRGPVGEVVVNP